MFVKDPIPPKSEYISVCVSKCIYLVVSNIEKLKEKKKKNHRGKGNQQMTGCGCKPHWKTPTSQAEGSKSHAWTFNAGGEATVGQEVCLGFSITWKTQYLQRSLIEMK